MKNKGLEGEFAGIGKKFAQYLEAKAREKIGQSGAVNTGALRNSATARPIAPPQGGFVAVRLSFAQHGRFQDMKKLRWQNPPPPKWLAEWAMSAGVVKAPGYKDPSSLPPFKAAQRAAFAIARAKAKRPRHRQRPWKNETVGTAAAYLAHLASEATSKIAAETVVRTLEK